MTSELILVPLFDTLEYLSEHLQKCKNSVSFKKCPRCEHFKYYCNPLSFKSRTNQSKHYKNCQKCIHFELIQKERGMKASSSWPKDILQSIKSKFPIYVVKEYWHALSFLLSYRESQDSFNAYRREMERFFQWSWFICQKGVLSLKARDIKSFIQFCEKPPKSWIGLKTVSRFLDINGQRVPNPEWRPFNIKVNNKVSNSEEEIKFKMSQQGTKLIVDVLGAFYKALTQMKVIESNPILQIRLKYKSKTKQWNTKARRDLSECQWETVLTMAQQLAKEDPSRYNQAPRIIQALYRKGLGMCDQMSLQNMNYASGKQTTPCQNLENGNLIEEQGNGK